MTGMELQAEAGFLLAVRMARQCRDRGLLTEPECETAERMLAERFHAPLGVLLTENPPACTVPASE